MQGSSPPFLTFILEYRATKSERVLPQLSEFERFNMKNEGSQDYQLPKLKKHKPDGHIDGMASVDTRSPSSVASPMGYPQQPAANHRPVTSCSHCRQHKIKCDAHHNFPAPCSRCTKYGLHCEIDPQFKPKKGSQMQMMRRDIDDLKIKVNSLLANESALLRRVNDITSVSATPLASHHTDNSIMSPYQSALENAHGKAHPNIHGNMHPGLQGNSQTPSNSTKISVQTYLVTEPALLAGDGKRTASNVSGGSALTNGSKHDGDASSGIPNTLQMALQRGAQTDEDVIASATAGNSSVSRGVVTDGVDAAGAGSSGNPSNGPVGMVRNAANGESIKHSPVVVTTETLNPLPSPYTNIDEFVLGDVHISMETATHLHATFVKEYLPCFPIMFTNNVTELYSQSQLLFWTVMLTACLSNPEPTLYSKLSILIKQLAIETCWMRTPRSTHITQALLILCIWPLPNQKVLDDCSYRFVGLAKSLSYQLGLHRGEFITEFTRSQTSMPNAEKWRTRTWLGLYFAELCWASILGLPPTSQTDYLVQNALNCNVEEDSDSNEVTVTHEESAPPSTDPSSNANATSKPRSKFNLPSRFKNMISLAHFQQKLCNVMGSSVISPDGLIEPRERAGMLAVLDKQLDSLATEADFEQSDDVYIYYLYVRLMVYCFAFFPGTPIEDQSKYVTDSYLCATKIVTLLTKLLKKHQLISLPIFIRQSVTFSALILFKLQLTPLLPNQYLNSARQSIVTVHRLFRNQLTAWATVENDISRTASMLEKLNLVLITHAEVFIEESGVISRMRSHMTGSVFYDLVWCVHEARRREMDPKYNEAALKRAKEKRKQNKDGDAAAAWDKKLYPLPLYNHITRDDFKTVTQTTPGGTTVTTLVPTKTALKHAEELAKNKDSKDSAVMEINGIPLFMLDETGSVKIDEVLGSDKAGINVGQMGSNVHNQGYISDNTPMNHSSVSGPAAGQNSAFLNSPNSDYGTYYPVTNPNNGNNRPTRHSVHAPYNNNTAGTPGNSTSLFGNNIPRPSSATQLADGKGPGALPNAKLVNNGSPAHVNNIDAFLNNKKRALQQPKTAGNGNGMPASDNARAGTVENGDGSVNPINDFFQQQGVGWTEGNLSNDDFFGWFDMNMAPEF